MNGIVSAEKDQPSTKWYDFYDNDGYDNMPLAAKKLKFLRQYIRTLGDSDDEDRWERQLIMATSEARVMMLSNTHREMDDDQLAKKLREKLIDKL